jgi:hypothetical protein
MHRRRLVESDLPAAVAIAQISHAMAKQLFADDKSRTGPSYALTTPRCPASKPS